jgi:perosamine synthetase
VSSSSLEPIPLSVPQLGGAEWDYVRECLDTNWVSSAGPFVTRFEQLVAERAGRKCGIATASGTAALHIALICAGVESGDEVIVPSLTFIAPANAVRYVGAWPLFADVEPNYAQLDASLVAAFLESCVRRDGAIYNARSGRRIRAIMTVDLLGHPADADAIRAIAERHQLPVIEDATESLGARYKGRPVGSGGDIACFSFNGNKVITAGGGGVMVTDDEAVARRARYLTTQARDHATEYIHHHIGFNYRLTNVHAAIGVAQLAQLDAHIAAKRAIAARYCEMAADIDGVTLITEAPWARSIYWLCTIRVDAPVFGKTSRQLQQHLASLNIEARPLWQPLHLSPAHQGADVVAGRVAEKLAEEALSLPSSPGLTRAQQDRVIDAIVTASRA